MRHFISTGRGPLEWNDVASAPVDSIPCSRPIAGLHGRTAVYYVDAQCTEFPGLPKSPVMTAPV